MARIRHSAEQIIGKLREAEVLLGQGHKGCAECSPASAFAITIAIATRSTTGHCGPLRALCTIAFRIHMT